MTYHKIGAGFALAHLLLFLSIFLRVVFSDEAQIQLLYIPIMVLDIPLSLLYLFDIESLKSSLEAAGYLWMAKLFYTPLLVDGILGTVWWYFLPKLFISKRLGGVWDAKDER